MKAQTCVCRAIFSARVVLVQITTSVLTVRLTREQPTTTSQLHKAVRASVPLDMSLIQQQILAMAAAGVQLAQALRPIARAA